MLNSTEKANFGTLENASASGHLALLECTDKKSGERVPTICAVNFDGETYEFVPLARLFTGNPYDEIEPPNPNDVPEGAANA